MEKNFTANHDNISVGYAHCKVILDKQGEPVDFLFISVNRAYEEFICEKKKNIVGKTFAETHSFLKNDSVDYIKRFGAIAMTGKSEEFCFFSAGLNKWVTVFALSGGYLHFSAFFNARTKDEQLEDELKKANYVNSLLLDSIPHPALLVRKDRAVIAANEIARELGAAVGGICRKGRGKSNNTKNIPKKNEVISCFFCKGNEMLNMDDPASLGIEFGNRFWNIYRVPTREENVCLHYAIDITDAKKREDEIKFLSYHDSLTGVYNRTYLEKYLKEINESEAFPVSVIVGDLNGLKMTNDVFGHKEGDNLLKNAAQVIQNVCGDAAVARFGGDEFVVILENTAFEKAKEICEKISRSCKAQCYKIVPTSIALGCGAREDGKEDIYKTLTAAEDRMYRQKLSESKETKKAILASLQATLESRGVDTKEHSLRLVAATAKVGSALGLGKSETEELALLSRLHDIGKIMVDENILKKPGRLTESEYIEVQKHSEAGYRIAQSSTELIRISEYILSHHERWDGKGYPQGLKGEEIPFLSRVFSIADAYDAMTNDTHYRKAMGKTEAFEEIKRCAGTQFDPKLAGVFISALSGDEES